MNISQLLKGIVDTKINLEVSGICMNTENAHAGDIFIALKGEKCHGIKYIGSAIEKGCVAVLVDSKDIECSIPSIRIDSLERYLEKIAASFYKNAKKISLIGITGTNGKTSVGYFISQMLSMLEVNNGFIGTLGISNYKDKHHNSANTTPDIISLYRTLEHYYNNNINIAVLEVSSHSLSQNRIAGLSFMQAIFTNLSQDHLDYHKTITDYRNAKGKLFSINSVKSAIINEDDDNFEYFLKKSSGKNIIKFSLSNFKSRKIIDSGFLCQLDNYIFELSLLGEFNLSNMLAALNSIEELGYSRDSIIPLLPNLKPPTGRMHKINNMLSWVDYAHTPDAIFNALSTLKEHFPSHKVRVLFGCGGDRDKGKRAKMGKIASKLANSIILTNDNPRNEDPKTIIDDIASGIDSNFEVEIILDRKLAIETAISTLKNDECLLIAGKGHETIQQFKDRVIEINDIEIAINASI